MWEKWDKLSDINGVSAQEYLKQNRHLVAEETIYVKMVTDKIVQVEGKTILSKIYGIDETLNDEEFLVEYQDKITEMNSVESDINFDPYVNRLANLT